MDGWTDEQMDRWTDRQMGKAPDVMSVDFLSHETHVTATRRF